MVKQLASILVGDHLGQVKKVLIPSGEISVIPDCAKPSSANPIVSIEQIPSTEENKQLIANQDGQLFIHDAISGTAKQCEITGSESLVRAIPFGHDQDNLIFIYDKQIHIEAQAGQSIKLKRGQLKHGKVYDNKLAVVGQDTPLKVFDINTRNKIFEASFPDKNWLGIEPECFVSGLDVVGLTRIATCSKSDSVIRIYDTRQASSGKSCGVKPVIQIDLTQTAFNEHGDSNKYNSIASTGTDGHQIVIGSNVGQMLAIDLRLNVKQMPKKRLQPKSYKVLGGFKGARGATIKDVKVIQSHGVCEEFINSSGNKVISCCLDRYLRIHDFSKTRQLEKHFFMKTKPICCLPVFYDG